MRGPRDARVRAPGWVALLAACLFAGSVLGAGSAGAQATSPTVAAATGGLGKPTVASTSFDLADVGYEQLEFTISGRRFHFGQGSSIHTENSHKYGARGGRVLLLTGGWTPVAEWTDAAEDFAEILAVAEPERFAP